MTSWRAASARGTARNTGITSPPDRALRSAVARSSSTCRTAGAALRYRWRGRRARCRASRSGSAGAAGTPTGSPVPYGPDGVPGPSVPVPPGSSRPSG
ncbi:hypothetical protein C3486_10220 [Streptomyces sp. Ru73]|nr:hypothetical protein C3486_10220 [Streptomyces sp. Ru73]